MHKENIKSKSVCRKCFAKTRSVEFDFNHALCSGRSVTTNVDLVQENIPYFNRLVNDNENNKE